MFVVEKLNLNKSQNVKDVTKFLTLFNLEYDINVIDETFAIFDQDNIIATASCYSNVIKCVAVNPGYQQNNLTNSLITTILYELNQTYDEIFVISKPDVKNVFLSFGFKIIYHNDVLIFLTNRYDLFEDYLTYLKHQAFSKGQKHNNAAIVMNCNPFTWGHLHLIETASAECQTVYVLPVKEDVSLFPYEVRKQLINAGTKHLNNVVVLNGSNYLISRAVFPSYFIKSKTSSIKNQALLDANIFGQYFVPNLKIVTRYLGEEPLSPTTNSYNNVLQQVLPKYHVNIKIIPRLVINKQVVSASTVRQLWANNKIADLRKLVPNSTYEFLMSIDGQKILKKATTNQIVKNF